MSALALLEREMAMERPSSSERTRPGPLSRPPILRENKVVNAVPVSSLREALRYANVSSQTVGGYPPSRKAEARDALAAAGTRRVVRLGRAGAAVRGLPHDGFYPLNRFVRWVDDED
jgi:Acyl-CoA reductase (LuxC)